MSVYVVPLMMTLSGSPLESVVPLRKTFLLNAEPSEYRQLMNSMIECCFMHDTA